jgi:AbrB family looped-hinge helix DNA binding protein
MSDGQSALLLISEDRNSRHALPADRKKPRPLKSSVWPSIKLTNLIDHVIVIRNNIDRGFDMQIVTVSPKYQVVIPKAVREALQLRPGQKMQVVEYDGRIELIPERDIKELRGFLKGINTGFEREQDRV